MFDRPYRGGSAEKSLHSAITVYMQFAIDNPDLYQLMFQRPVPDFVPSQESMAVSWDALAFGQQEVATIMDRGEIDSGLPPDETQDLIIALTHGLTELHLANNPDLPIGQGRFGKLIDQSVGPAALANTCFDFNQGAELSGLAEAILDARCSGGCEPEQDPASRWATSGGCAASEEVALRDGNSVQIICEGNSSDEALETAIASGIASARICADGQLWQNSGEQQGDLRVLFTLQSDDGDEVVCCHNVEF
jgi:hypothetical protein